MTFANSQETTELSPSYAVPAGLLIISLPLLWLQVWIGGIIALFSLFLAFQAATLRLIFTSTDLDIYRSASLIRRFPYTDWQNWEIFWVSFPVLFYFKEVKSIHFLPILFDPKTLETCLNRHFPKH